MKRLTKVLLLFFTLGLAVGCGGNRSFSSSIDNSSISELISSISDITSENLNESSTSVEIPNVVLSETNATVKAGEYIEVTASLSIPNTQATYVATIDKSYATVTIEANVIKVSLDDNATVGETVVVSVSSDGASPAELTIVVAEKEVVITCYTIYFYESHIGEENLETLQNALKVLIKSAFDRCVFQTSYSGVSVELVAKNIQNYNSQHDYKIDAILGLSEDKNDALSNAGYKKESEQTYTYGIQPERKLWIAKESVNPTGDALLKKYLLTNYATHQS